MNKQAVWQGLFKGVKSILMISTLMFFFVVCGVTIVSAHMPHDVIDAVEISLGYDQDNTLFVSIRGKFLISTDGGRSWKKIIRGLDNKSLFSCITISPFFNFDKTLFLASKRDGIYKSQDGGYSWSKANDGLDSLGVRLLGISPYYNQDKVVFAAGSEAGLYKSKDGGESWYHVIDKGIKVSAIAFFYDEKKDHVLIGDDTGILYLSSDGGETWEQHFQTPNCGGITCIAVSPNVFLDNTYFVGTEKGGVLRTFDGGISYEPVNNGLSEPQSTITSLAISPDYETTSTIFGSTWYDAVFRSDDGGKTWKKYGTGVTTDPQADEPQFKSPHFMDLKISNTYKKDNTLFLGGFDGLFKSTDGGGTWKQMETLSLRPITGLAISPEYRDDSTIAICTYDGGAYITYDQGSTWEVINRGLRETHLWDIDFSPNFSSDRTAFTISNHAFYESTNGGTDWNRIDLGHLTRMKRNLFSLYKKSLGRFFGTPKILKEADPYPTRIEISPDFAFDKTIYMGTRYEGVLKSVDGGENWFCVLEASRSSNASISPNFANDQTVYASVFGKGIYNTLDGGNVWQLLFPEADQANPSYFSLAISPNYKKDKTVFAGSSGSPGLLKTVDGGKRWQKLEVCSDGNCGSVGIIAISPNYEDDRTLIVNVRGKGLFRSSDGGSTFTGIGHDMIKNNHFLRRIRFSPAYSVDHTIYGAGEELFRSKDGGNTWTRIARPIRYEDNKRDVMSYQGKWERKWGDFSASTITRSNVAQSKVILDFVGTGVSWIGTESRDQGIAKVFIDGKFREQVDQFSDSRNGMVNSYSIANLEYGPHSIMIEVSGTKKSESKGFWVVVDGFDIRP